MKESTIWGCFYGLKGVYSCFVNKNLSDIGEFRTLFRLNPEVYQNAHTSIKDEALPLWPEDYQGKKVFEAWLDTNSTGYITNIIRALGYMKRKFMVYMVDTKKGTTVSGFFHQAVIIAAR